MTVSFPNHEARRDGPAVAGEAVDISTTDAVPTLGEFARGVFVGVAGDVKVDFAGGGTGIVMKAVAIGEHAWVVTKIYKTGTTATNLVFLY